MGGRLDRTGPLACLSPFPVCLWIRSDLFVCVASYSSFYVQFKVPKLLCEIRQPPTLTRSRSSPSFRSPLSNYKRRTTLLGASGSCPVIPLHLYSYYSALVICPQYYPRLLKALVLKKRKYWLTHTRVNMIRHYDYVL